MTAAGTEGANMAQLSDSQLVVLSAACRRADRSVYPLTIKLPGGAVAKVLTSLINKGLIKEVQAGREDTVWREDKKRGRITLRATPAAFKALGIEDDTPAVTAPGSGTDTATDKGSKPTGKPADTPRTRAGSKQAQLIEMLKRPDGATTDEIMATFNWQSHTVRGAIAGALKKKLGLNVTSEKVEDRGRVYKIG